MKRKSKVIFSLILGLSLSACASKSTKENSMSAEEILNSVNITIEQKELNIESGNDNELSRIVYYQDGKIYYTMETEELTVYNGEEGYYGYSLEQELNSLKEYDLSTQEVNKIMDFNYENHYLDNWNFAMYDGKLLYVNESDYSLIYDGKVILESEYPNFLRLAQGDGDVIYVIAGCYSTRYGDVTEFTASFYQFDGTLKQVWKDCKFVAPISDRLSSDRRIDSLNRFAIIDDNFTLFYINNNKLESLSLSNNNIYYDSIYMIEDYILFVSINDGCKIYNINTKKISNVVFDHIEDDGTTYSEEESFEIFQEKAQEYGTFNYLPIGNNVFLFQYDNVFYKAVVDETNGRILYTSFEDGGLADNNSNYFDYYQTDDHEYYILADYSDIEAESGWDEQYTMTKTDNKIFYSLTVNFNN